MREKKGLTVEQLAEKIIESNNFTAIAHQTIVEDLKNFEIGLDPIKLGYNVVFIAKALCCSVEELIEG